MFSVWLKTVSLFSKKEKHRIAFLFLCSILVSIVELAGIASIMPFIASISSPELVETQPLLSRLYNWFNFENYRNYIIALGLLSFCIMFISYLLGITYSWITVRFVNMKEYEISTALLQSYLKQNFEKTSNRNTSELSKNILQDVENVISGILFCGMDIVNSAIATVFIVILLLFMDPIATVSSTLIFTICYGVIFRFISPKIQELGKDVKELYAQMYIGTQQALDGLKEIKANDREAFFVRKYATPRKTSAINYIAFKTIDLIPKYLLELTAYGLIIAGSIYFIYQGENLGMNYSIIAMFAFAAYRIIPMVKRVFEGMENFDYYRTFIDILWDDLSYAQHPSVDTTEPTFACSKIDQIELRDIRFCYESNIDYALDNISLTIRAGERICLIGPSGAGKTTTVDIILGLLVPESGSVLINDGIVSPEKFATVRCRIGYVPQNPYLLDDSLQANIEFGEDTLDSEQLALAYDVAGLSEIFGSSITEAMKIMIGQHGGRLSGGQRQRIAIARALCKKPDVLILDESTNGLDLVTEQRLLDKLDSLDHMSILFISHRPSIMRACGRIIVIEQGKVVAEGSHSEIENNERYNSLLR
jgi:ABC-type multidrug transport system fused ATPase/permease subunit